MTAFFDPNLSEQWGGIFCREDKIEDSLRRLIPKAYITTGRYTYPSRAELRDLRWNHMDQNHRPLIHRTYGDATRIFIGEHAAFSLTRFGRWPIVLPVFDGFHKENGFYQIVCLFGAIVVVNIIESNAAADGTQMDISWFVASHRLLRFLHRPLNKRLRRLNEVQNHEDDTIRDRRVALRAHGYRFKTDEPDFRNSNVLENNVIFPPLTAPGAVALETLPIGQPIRVEQSGRAYILLRRMEAPEVEVWPGICSHEGAALDPTNLRARTVVCPWHGLEYGARRLTPQNPSVEMCGARLELAEGRIMVQPLVEVRVTAV